MRNKDNSSIFDQKTASSYDRQRAGLAPIKEALHLLIRMVLGDLRADARILCVGVGTGAELIELARSFPQWQFCAVEPAAPMLEICKKRAIECGIAARCTFHQGYIDSLESSQKFDAATAILVSHFLTDPQQRRDLFRRIGGHLHPNGILVNADLASDMNSPAYDNLIQVWLRAHKFADMPADPADFGEELLCLSRPG